MPLLNPGDPFPRLTVNTTDGQALTIPDAFAGDFAVVLFNRGAWCPFCNAQLRAFERASATLAETGIRVAALSVDDKETAAEMVAKHKLTFPVGYGADAPGRRRRSPAPSSTQTRCTCSPPASCSTPRVTSSSACTRAAPSGGSSPMTSWASSATCASTRLPRQRDRTGHGSMTDTDFYFDPVCPFAWKTSKWVRMVAVQRDYTVDWRFISLRMINSGIAYDSHFPAAYEEGHTSGLRLLRVGAARGGGSWQTATSSLPRRPDLRAALALSFRVTASAWRVHYKMCRSRFSRALGGRVPGRRRSPRPRGPVG